MPYQSRYQSAEFESILNEMLDVLRARNLDTTYSLMLLGNALTHVFNTQVPSARRHAMAQEFAQALLKSVEDKTH